MPPPLPASGIELAGVAKSYGSVEAVRGVDISVEPGETVALLAPDRGDVRVFGRAPGDAVAAGDVGAMLQTGSLLRDLTVRELVTMMASLYPEPLGVDEAIELVGLQSIASQRTQKLSGGQTQRVRFALALVTNPALLVLDEPTVAMDVESRHAFWTTMRGL